jgi:hypothetical protein
MGGKAAYDRSCEPAMQGQSGKWQVASGKWQVASGKWQVASGKWFKVQG